MKKHNLLLTIALIWVIGFSACTKADFNDTVTKGDPPPVPGGYVNSSEVASGNLLAYWNFDNNKTETKSNILPVNDSNSSYVSGIKGQALHLNMGYLLYPTIPALSTANAISSVTVSLWMNVSNNGSTFTELFTLARDTTKEADWLSILNVGIETGHNASEQKLALHSWIGSFPSGSRKGGDNINDYGNVGVDYQTLFGAGKWVHYIMRYDGTTENIDLYANNIRVSNNNFRNRAGVGPLVLPTPTQVLFGAFSNNSSHFPKSSTLGFHGFLNGSLDEVRVYSKALSDAEISALFKLERQGR